MAITVSRLHDPMLPGLLYLGPLAVRRLEHIRRVQGSLGQHWRTPRIASAVRRNAPLV